MLHQVLCRERNEGVLPVEFGLSHHYDPAVLLYSPRKGIFQQEETRADPFGVQGTSARALPLALGLQQMSEVESVRRSTHVYSSCSAEMGACLWFSILLSSEFCLLTVSHQPTFKGSDFTGSISASDSDQLIHSLLISITALQTGTIWWVSEH